MHLTGTVLRTWKASNIDGWGAYFKWNLIIPIKSYDKN